MTTQTRTIVFASTVILIGAIFLLLQSPRTHSSAAPTDASTARSRSTASPDTGSSGSRERKAPDNADLAAKYSESRTNLAKQTAKGMMELSDQYVHALSLGDGELKELFLRLETNKELIANALPGEIRAELAVGGSPVFPTLTDGPTKEKALAVINDYVNQSLEAKKTALAGIRKDPRPLLELLLAADAKARGKMSDEEFSLIRDRNQTTVSAISGGFMSGMMLGDPYRDPVVNERLRTLLSPEQWTAWESQKNESREPSFEAREMESIEELLTYTRVVVAQMFGTKSEARVPTE